MCRNIIKRKHVDIVYPLSYQFSMSVIIFLYNEITRIEFNIIAFVTKLTYAKQIMFQAFYQKYIINHSLWRLTNLTNSKYSTLIVISIGDKSFSFRSEKGEFGFVSRHVL